MSGTTDQRSVPATNGFSTVFPETGLRIYREIVPCEGTADLPMFVELIYPDFPEPAQEQPK